MGRGRTVDLTSWPFTPDPIEWDYDKYDNFHRTRDTDCAEPNSFDFPYSQEDGKLSDQELFSRWLQKTMPDHKIDWRNHDVELTPRRAGSIFSK